MKTSRLPADDSRLFARMQKYRAEADYGRDFIVTTEAARGDLVECEELIARVSAVIAGAGYAP